MEKLTGVKGLMKNAVLMVSDRFQSMELLKKYTHHKSSVNAGSGLLTSLLISGCGGGGSTPVNNATEATPAKPVVATLSPLHNASVYIDVDAPGTAGFRVHSAGDSPIATTNAQGVAVLDTWNEAAGAAYVGSVVVETNENTIDTQSGAFVPGIKLSAPEGFDMITTTTTMVNKILEINEGKANYDVAQAEADVKVAFGIDADVELKSFNPYDETAAGYDAAKALKYTKASSQVVAIVNTFSEVAVGAGSTKEAATENVMTALAKRVDKAVTDNNTSEAAGGVKTALDLGNADTITEVVTNFKAESTTFKNAVETGAAANSITNLKTAIVTVNSAISNLAVGESPDAVNEMAKSGLKNLGSDAGAGKVIPVLNNTTLDKFVTISGENEVSKAVSSTGAVAFTGATDRGDLKLSGKDATSDYQFFDNAGTKEVTTFTFGATAFTGMASSDTLAFDGLTFTSNGSDTIDTFVAAMNEGSANTKVTGTERTGFVYTKASATELRVTQDAPHTTVANLAIFDWTKTGTGSALPTGVVVNTEGVTGFYLTGTATPKGAFEVVQGVKEQTKFTFAADAFTGMSTGDTLKFDGITYTSADGNDTINTFVAAMNSIDTDSADSKVSGKEAVGYVYSVDGTDLVVTTETGGLAADLIATHSSGINGFAGTSAGQPSAVSVTVQGVDPYWQYTVTGGKDSSGANDAALRALSSAQTLKEEWVIVAKAKTDDGVDDGSAIASVLAVTATSGATGLVANQTGTITATGAGGKNARFDLVTDGTGALTIAVNSVNKGSDYKAGDVLTLSGTDLVNAGIKGAGGGDITLTVDATSALLNNTMTIKITMQGINDTPVILSDSSQAQVTSVNEDSAYAYTFNVTDADVATGSDQVTKTAVTDLSNSWLSFNAGTGLLSGTPDNSNVGTHAVVLKATDSAGLEVKDTFTITVNNVNDAPTVSSVPVNSATEDIAYSYTFSATDDDSIHAGVSGSTVTLAATEKPAWLSFSDGVLSGTPKNSHVGTHPVTLVASDGIANTSQSFNIQVAAVDDAPIFDVASIPNMTIGKGSQFSYTFSASDEDSDTVTLGIHSASFNPDGSSEVASDLTTPGTGANGLQFSALGSGSASLTGTPTTLGTYTIVVKAEDATNKGDSATKTNSFTIRVDADVPRIGYAFDGPIESASAFIDMNKNGIFDSGDSPKYVTDSNGKFEISNPGGAFDSGDTVLVADASTKDTISGVFLDGLSLEAPNGYVMVSPLTTLVNLIHKNPNTSLDVPAAEVKVKAALGLASDLDLKTINPYDASTFPAGYDVTKALAYGKVATQVVTIANTFSELATGAEKSVAMMDAMTGMARYIESNTSVDFADTAILTGIKNTIVALPSSASVTAFTTSITTGPAAAQLTTLISGMASVNASINALDSVSSNAAKVALMKGQSALSDLAGQAAAGQTIPTIDLSKMVTIGGTTSVTKAVASDGSLSTGGTLVLTGPDASKTYSFANASLSSTTDTGKPAKGDLTIATGTANGSLPASTNHSWTYNVTSATQKALLKALSRTEVVSEEWLMTSQDSASTADLVNNTKLVSIEMTGINDAPVKNSTGITTSTEDVLYEYVLSATDPDNGDNLTYTAVELPSWLSFDAASRKLSGTPSDANVPGKNALFDLVTDANATLTVTIDSANKGTGYSVGEKIKITEAVLDGAGFVATSDLLLTVASVGAGGAITGVTPTSGNTGLAQNQTGANLAAEGASNVVLRVTDADTEFTFAADAFSGMSNGQTLIFDGLTFTSDGSDTIDSYITAMNLVNSKISGGTSSSYSFSKNGNNLVVEQKTGNTLNHLEAGDFTGSSSGKPIAARVVGEAVTETFRVTVNNVNDAPVVNTEGVTSATEDSAYSYTFSATDADAVHGTGSTITLSATQKPTWLSFDATSGKLSGTPDNSHVGNHSVTLTASDGIANTLQSFDIFVTNV